MKDVDNQRDCGCWRVALPDRKTDFEAVRECDARCAYRMSRRVRWTFVGLGACLIAGFVAGAYFARRTDVTNTDKLRELYLSRVENGGTGR